jgi:hypothetical protein
MSCSAKKLTELIFPATTFTGYHHQQKGLFDNIYGYDDIKRVFRMDLDTTNDTCSILLSGPPASTKTLFLQCLMRLHNSYFINCSNATKSGMVDYIFDHKESIFYYMK